MKARRFAVLLLAPLLLLCSCAGARTQPAPAEQAPEQPEQMELLELLPQTWYANCDEYINLRAAPNTSAGSMAQIPSGAEFTLLAWQDRFAWVEYEGQRGWVLTSYIKPSVEADQAAGLSVVEPTACYTYDQMWADLKALADRYPETLRLDSIGVSGEGREIPVLLLGNPEAEHHVLLQGAIHAREHMTAWLLCALADYWAGHDAGDFGGVCFHIIPMVNPDGVTIAQTGQLTPLAEEIYASDLELDYTEAEAANYALRWKANGLGVDLNRNFDAGWRREYGRPGPSSELYWGDAPCCAPEAAALRDYTLSRSFDATVSYHASGSVIYYEYGDDPALKERCKSLGEAVGKITGYALMGSDTVESGGYKDWAIASLGIPSLTLEIGCQDAPLEERELDSIFARNLNVLPALARWAAQQTKET